MSNSPNKLHDKSITLTDFSFDLICDWFEEKHGHGWKRRLAEVAGVPESNVRGWIKSGRMPPWVQKIFHLLIKNSHLRRSERFTSAIIADASLYDQVVEDRDGYTVYRNVDGVGKIIASGISDIETAQEIAALPKLKNISGQVSAMLNDLIEHQIVPEDWFNEAESKVLEDFDNWRSRPELAVLQTDEVINDIAEALESLTIEIGEVQS
jgi:hypothetical protein